MDADSRIYVAGHRGMVGSAVLRRLATTSELRTATPGDDLARHRRQSRGARRRPR